MPRSSGGVGISGNFRRESWSCPCGQNYEFMSDIGPQSPPATEFRCPHCSTVQLVRGRLLSASWKDGDQWTSLTVT